jgi:hypothetical protein
MLSGNAPALSTSICPKKYGTSPTRLSTVLLPSWRYIQNKIFRGNLPQAPGIMTGVAARGLTMA